MLKYKQYICCLFKTWYIKPLCAEHYGAFGHPIIKEEQGLQENPHRISLWAE